MGYKENFIDVVVASSESDNWQDAKTEWSHLSSFDEPDSNCICGQHITEVCTIKNTLNGSQLEVGNVCVKKFLDIDRASDFKLIKKDLIDEGLLLELFNNKVISESDYHFYKAIKLKRNLSYKQLNWKNKILLKSKQWVTKSGKGKVDPILFKNLETMTKEQKEYIGGYLIEWGYKIKHDNSGMTIKNVMQKLKEMLINLNKFTKNEK